MLWCLASTLVLPAMLLIELHGAFDDGDDPIEWQSQR